MLMCLLTHPDSLHLGPERIQKLKQDQTQRVNVHFVRVRVSRELSGQNGEESNVRLKSTFLLITEAFVDSVHAVAAHLLWAHVELGADLARVPGQKRGGRQGAWLVLVLLLVHGRHQAEVSHLHHVVHGEEDVRGLGERWRHACYVTCSNQ